MNFLGITNLSNDDNVSKIIEKCNQHFHYKKSSKVSLYSTNIWTWKNQYEYKDNYSVIFTKNYWFLGTGFVKNSVVPITEKDLNQDCNIESFLEKIDGEYTLLQHNCNKITILRSPSSQMPVFFVNITKNEIMFSNKIENLSLFYNINDINWDYLCSFLIHGNLISNYTPFNKCHEVPYGCSLEITKKNTLINRAWKAENYYLKPQQDNIDELLVNDLELSLKQITHGADEVFLEFSSGIDSTSILLCLNNILQSNQKILPIHFYNPESSAANELDLAKKICDGLKLPLITYNYLDFLPFSFCKLPFKPDKPANFLIYQNMENVLASNISKNKSFKFLSGHGGDNLLLTPPPLELLSDYFNDYGFEGLKAKMLDLFAYCRVPLLKLAKEILVCKLKLKKHHHRKKMKWMSKSFNKFQHKKFQHPIYLEKTNIQLGKLFQINGMDEGFSLLNLNLRTPGNYTSYPFLYQRMLEACLSIPTYKLFDKGYDRYPIRKGISTKFNTDVIWRKNKGEMSSIMQNGIKKNVKYITERCLEGNFAKKGLINKDKTYQAIVSVCNGKHEEQWFIAQLTMIEVFLEYWQ